MVQSPCTKGRNTFKVVLGSGVRFQRWPDGWDCKIVGERKDEVGRELLEKKGWLFEAIRLDQDLTRFEQLINHSQSPSPEEVVAVKQFAAQILSGQ